MLRPDFDNIVRNHFIIKEMSNACRTRFNGILRVLPGTYMNDRSYISLISRSDRRRKHRFIQSVTTVNQFDYIWLPFLYVV